MSSVGADAVGECYTTGYSVVQYVNVRKQQFPDFTSLVQAFAQNLIGNVLNFNQLYNNIMTAAKADRESDVFFYAGRLTYLVLYFDPLVSTPFDDFDTEIEQDNYNAS